MKVAVLDINGKDTGRKADLSNKVFAIEPNNHAVYLDVKQYLAKSKQGTHKVKEREKLLVVQENKEAKGQELPELVVLNLAYLKEEDVFLVLDQETMVSN